MSPRRFLANCASGARGYGWCCSFANAEGCDCASFGIVLCALSLSSLSRPAHAQESEANTPEPWPCACSGGVAVALDSWCHGCVLLVFCGFRHVFVGASSAHGAKRWYCSWFVRRVCVETPWLDRGSPLQPITACPPRHCYGCDSCLGGLIVRPLSFAMVRTWFVARSFWYASCSGCIWQSIELIVFVP